MDLLTHLRSVRNDALYILFLIGSGSGVAKNISGDDIDSSKTDREEAFGVSSIWWEKKLVKDSGVSCIGLLVSLGDPGDSGNTLNLAKHVCVAINKIKTIIILLSSGFQAHMSANFKSIFKGKYVPIQIFKITKI